MDPRRTRNALICVLERRDLAAARAAALIVATQAPELFADVEVRHALRALPPAGDLRDLLLTRGRGG